MSKKDTSDDPDLLDLSKDIKLLESRRQQLVERRELGKDKSELKKIEKQLKQIDTLLRKLRNTEAKVLRAKAG